MYKKTDNYIFYEVESNQSVDYMIELGKSVSQIATNDKSIIYRQNATFAFTDKGIYKPIGYVIKDSKSIQTTTSASKWSAFIVPKIGRPYIGQLDPNNSSEIKLAFQSTPQIVKNGQIFINTASEGTPIDVIRSVKRSAIGAKSNGTVVLVTTTASYTLDELAELMINMGCIEALNLDGGGSVTSNYMNEEVTTYERPVSAAIVIRQKEELIMPYVALDAGHGSDTYEKTGGKGVPTMEEHTFNAAVVGYTKELAEYNGIKVLLTQPLNQLDVPLKQRTDKANAENVDLLISFHADAASNTTAKGHTAFYWHNSADSKKLATIWDKYADQIMKNGDRNTKACVPNTDTDFHMVRETKMVAMLVEHAFMTNPEELTLLKLDEYRRKCAEVAVRTLCEYFGMTFKTPVSNTADSKLKTNLATLQSEGVIQTPDYWIQNAVTGGVVKGEYAGILIESTTKKLIELENKIKQLEETISKLTTPSPSPFPIPNPEPTPTPKPETPTPMPEENTKTWDEIQQLATRTSVYFQVGLKNGTGVLVRNNYILTAKHIVADRDMKVQTSDKKWYDITLVATHPDENVDIAICRVNKATVTLPSLSISNKGIKTTQKLLSVGHGLNKKWTKKEGIVDREQTTIYPWVFDCSIPADYDDSGSGVINEYGDIVGIVIRKTSVSVKNGSSYELVRGSEVVNINHEKVRDWIISKIN